MDGSELEIEAQTICIHSDTPHALAIAGEVRMAMNKWISTPKFQRQKMSYPPSRSLESKNEYRTEKIIEAL